MAYRVAVASSGGKFINQHFGRAGQFLIFDVNEGEIPATKFVALRKSDPLCHAGQHDEERLEAAVNRLADCQVVLAAKIGLGASAALATRGIAALEITAFIDEALAQVGRSIRRILPGRVKNETAGCYFTRD